MISYISTRGAPAQNFGEILLGGLAPDGGLYLPEIWPQIDIKALKNKSYIEIAESVMFPFVDGCLDRRIFRKFIHEIYNDNRFPGGIAPLKEVYSGLYVMELFHGPTIAFKDIALQFLGPLFESATLSTGKNLTIVGATSGDTGSAAIEGCRHAKGTSVFIVFPEGRVSDVQRRQMTTIDAPNVHSIAVKGTFDDCQNLVKAMFGDADFRTKINLSAVNSINWARIMAQIVYYFYAAEKLQNPSFVVPTGNFGNVFAGYAAQKMGAAIGDLCVATNDNDILTRFFESGAMKAADVHTTLSPSMDIQVSSNFERYLFDLMGRDAAQTKSTMDEFKSTGNFTVSAEILERARRDFKSARCTEPQTLETMRRVYDETGYILDPHTAVGFSAALNMKMAGHKNPLVVLGTAHPAKFPDAVERAIGIRPALPGHLSDLMEKPEKMTVLDNDIDVIKNYILKFQ